MKIAAISHDNIFRTNRPTGPADVAVSESRPAGGIIILVSNGVHCTQHFISPSHRPARTGLLL